MSADTFERVRDIIATRFKAAPERITRETSLVKDLGADSLDSLELVFQLEEAFGILIPNERIGDFATMGAICAGIETLQSSTPASGSPSPTPAAERRS